MSPEAAAMAPLIRALYFDCFRAEKLRREGVESDFGARAVPRYDGGVTDEGTFQPIWPRIAQLCLERQIEPAAFVRAQFGAFASRIARPNQLLGDGAVRRYESLARAREDDARRALAVQNKAFLAESEWRVARSGGRMTMRDAARSALRDRTLGLSGLFRYCYATRVGDPETAAQFRDSALTQYVYQRDVYDAAWGEWIPVTLRAAADRALPGRGSTGRAK